MYLITNASFFLSVVILATNPEYVPSFMVAAKRQGMTNGDYVYIVSMISDINQDQDLDYYWWYGISGKVDKTEAEQALHSALTLVPRPYNNAKYERFQKRVIEKSKTFPWERPGENPNKVSINRSDII